MSMKNSAMTGSRFWALRGGGLHEGFARVFIALRYVAGGCRVGEQRE